MTEIRVSSLGESVAGATIATWFRRTGGTVAADEVLCGLETDEVMIAVPAAKVGVLPEIMAEKGATVGRMPFWRACNGMRRRL